MSIGMLIRHTSLVCVFVLVACTAPSGAPSGPGAPSAGGPVDSEWQKIVAAAQKEGSVLAYTGIFRGNEDQAIADEFKRQTGINFDWVNAASTAPLAQRLRTEVQAGQPSADILEGSSQFVRQLKNDGFFISVKDKPLPTLKEPESVWKIHPLAMSAEGDIQISRPTSQYDGHIYVNTSLLPQPDWPKTFQDLASDPKYKGRIAWVDPKITGDAAARYIRQGYVGGSWTLKDIHSLYANQSMLLFPGPNEPGPAVGRGEMAISIGANTPGIPQLAKAGAPIKLLAFPEVPVVGNPNTMGVLKTAQHPNAALVFLNWFMSKEGQDTINRVQQTQGLRRDVANYVPDALRSEVIGGGKKGPMMALTDIQSDLASDLYAAGIFQKLTENLSLAEFEEKVNTFIKDWETKHGGPQKQAVPLQD